MVSFTRRRFLRTGSVAALAVACPFSFAEAQRRIAVAPRVGSPDLKALTEAALEAARAAGATYADVNFRSMLQEQSGLDEQDLFSPYFATRYSWGVRALVNGYWGFVGLDGTATVDDIAQMARDATAEAKTAAKGKTRIVELAPTPVVTGTWTTPIEVDPFAVSYEEKYDYLAGLNDWVSRLWPDIRCMGGFSCRRDEHTFASSEGSYITQTTYLTRGNWGFLTERDWVMEKNGYLSADFLSVAGAGWEYVRKSPIRERAMQLIEEALRSRRPKPVDVGRYDIVFDAPAMAHFLDASVGTATQLDRAMGYKANGVGTTYLNDPAEMLGTFKVGSPLLTVTTNRSMPQGAATVKWDDEGVAPSEATLVKDGILADYQTTREAASWIASYYNRVGMPVRSNGCACVFGSAPPMQRTPNLVMRPGTQNVTFEDLVKDTKRGLAVLGGGMIRTDFQALNGTFRYGRVYEVINGKLGTPIDNALVEYRAPEFWRNLKAIGGAQSAAPFGIEHWEDEKDDNRTPHTVSAVPAKVTGVAVADQWRRP